MPESSVISNLLDSGFRQNDLLRGTLNVCENKIFMKIHVLNDLHIEFGDFELPDTDAEVIVFAGDIDVGMGGLSWIEKQRLDKPVIYVPGNHEYYHHDISLVEEIKACVPPNVHVLSDDMVEINGVRFLGCTLWTDFLLFGETEKYFAVQYAKQGMADFQVIMQDGQRFSPEDSINLHENSRDWLGCMLGEHYAGKTVVVTHHLPSEKSVHPRFSRNLLTPAFASNLEALMDVDRVVLWVHGHTHDVFDYEIFGTRIVCNPRGYVPYEQSNEFQPDFVVEI